MHATRLTASRAHFVARTAKQARASGAAACTSICLPALLSTNALADQDDWLRLAPAERSLEEVVVTGTRLPLTVLSRRDIERGGADSIGKVLQGLPAITGSQLNTNVNGSTGEHGDGSGAGDGSVRADLRGGSLVLLNGRRFPNGGLGADASVDLNTIPMSLIERVEVLSGGASAVYGSDAVGGVINIVTRRSYDGVELSGSRAVTDHGDGEIVTGQGAVGFAAAGGDWGIGVDYARQDGVTLDRRGYSAWPLIINDEDGNRVFSGHFATPEGVFNVPAGNVLDLAPGRYTRVAGASGQTAADYLPFTRAVDGFNPAPYTYSQTPSERASLWLLGSRPLGDRAGLFVEGLYHQRTSEQRVIPESLRGLTPRPTLEDGSYGIPANNYYNPFGVDLTLPTARRFVEGGDRTVSEEIDLWRVLVGLEGAAGAWRWQVSAGEARSDATTVETGFFAQSRFIDALGPSGPDETGRIVCGVPDPATGRVPAASIIPGCVPLNVFGGPGSITQEQLDYMQPRPLVDTGTNEQRIAEVVLHGPWGQLGGQDVQWVAGAAYRREAGSLVQDPLHALDYYGDWLTMHVPRGQYEATELFAEVELPLVHDRPWARDVALNLGARKSDFSNFGRHTSWGAGLRWRTGEQLLLRASYADVFRAPSLAALFEPRLLTEDWALDPCGNDPTPEQRENCAANGVPNGAYVQSDPAFLVAYGGNPDLRPETGHTFGAGLTYTPAWANGLSVSIDYGQVVLEGSVGQAFLEDVLLGCAEYGTRQFCDAIRRSADGSLAGVATLNENFGTSEDRAIDLAIEWHATARLGEFSTRLLATWLERWDEQIFPDQEVHHNVGKDGLPRWRAAGNVDWRYGPWLLSAVHRQLYADSRQHSTFHQRF